MRVLITVLLCVALAGIKSGEDRTASSDPNNSLIDTSQVDIELIRDVSYGDTEDVFIDRIAGITVDDSGRVFIGDVGQAVIHVYYSNGNYLQSLGRRGRGPGEFASIAHNISPLQIRGGNLYAADQDGTAFPMRINVYSLKDLAFSHTLDQLAENRNQFEELEGYAPHQFYPREDGKFLVSYKMPSTDRLDEESVIRYYLQDENGRIVSDQVFERQDQSPLSYQYPSGYTVGFTFPFLEKSLFTVSDEGYIYVVRSTGEFLIEVYDRDLEYLGELQHSVTKKELNRNDLLEDAGEQESLILKNNNLPDTWPALDDMLIDDQNRMWLSTFAEDDEIHEWWVLDENGDVMATFDWPKDRPIETVKNGYVYTHEAEEETGLEEIVRYRIEMEPSNR